MEMEFKEREDKTESKIFFSGRERYIKKFNEKISLMESKNRTVINLFGVGGVGKSTLLQEYEIIAKRSNFRVIKFDFKKSIKTIDDFYHYIYEQLLRESIYAVYFTAAYVIYYQKRYPLSSIKEILPKLVKEGGAIAEYIDVFTKFGDEYLGAVGSALNASYKGYKKIKELMTLDKKVMQYIKDMHDLDKEEAQRKLMQFLVHDLTILDLKNNMRGTVFLFDTYEKIINKDLDTEVYDLVKMLDNSKSIFVIAGRFPLKWDDNFVSELEVIDLSLDECKDILRRNHIKEENIVDAIAKESKGLGIYLELAIRVYRKTKNKDINYYKELSFDKIFDRFIENHKEFKDELEVISIPNFFNFDIYHTLTNKGEIRFQDFIEADFIFNDEKKYFLHDLMNDLVLKKLSKSRIDELNKKMFSYYDNKIEAYIHNPIDIDSIFYFEALFHLNMFKEVEEMNLWFEKIEKLLLKSEQQSLMIDLYKNTFNDKDGNYLYKLFEFIITNNENSKLKDLHVGSYFLSEYYNWYAYSYSIEDMDSTTIVWLKKYGWHFISNYVMGAYLRFESTKGKVLKKSVRGWVSKYRKYEKEVSLLLINYLKKSDTSLQDVDDWVIEYLKENKSKSTLNLLTLVYFRKGGTLDAIVNIKNPKDIFKLYEYANYIFYHKNKKYKKYLAPYAKIYESFIQNYSIADQDFSHMKYLFMCSKYMKVENINIEIKNKIISDYENYILNYTYFHEDDYLVKFSPYDEYVEFFKKSDSAVPANEVILKIKEEYKNYILDNNINKKYFNYFLICSRYMNYDNLDNTVLNKIQNMYQQYINNNTLSNMNTYFENSYYLSICTKYLTIDVDKNNESVLKIEKVINDFNIEESNEKLMIEYGKLLTVMQNNQYEIPIGNIKDILNKYPKTYTTFLKIYLRDCHNDKNDAKILLLNFLSKNSKAIYQINTNIIPLFLAYLQNSEDAYSIHKELTEVLSLGMKHKNSGKIIVYFIRYGGLFIDIKALLDEYLDKHDSDGTAFILNLANTYQIACPDRRQAMDKLILYIDKFKRES